MTTAKEAQFWNKSAQKYAQSKIADPQGYDRSLALYRALLSQNDRVLELGCGTGSTALALAPEVESYLATDFSDEMIAIAQAKPGAAPGLSFRVATADDLVGQGDFTAVLAFSYLHLLHDLPATLSRIYDLTAPGGIFVSKTTCLAHMSPLIRFALPVMQWLGTAPHVATLTEGDLIQAIKDAGFTIESTEYHGTKGKDVRAVIVARKP